MLLLRTGSEMSGAAGGGAGLSERDARSAPAFTPRPMRPHEIVSHRGTEQDQSSDIDIARDTPDSSHGGDEGLGSMAGSASCVLTRRLADDREKREHPHLDLVRGGAGSGALLRLDRRTEAGARFGVVAAEIHA